MLNALRAGKTVSDEDFDAVFSHPARQLSHRHWTPVRVAQRAAKYLAPSADTTVLDVGSGAGKFCFVGALTTSGIFVGVEQRRRLFEEAASIKDSFGIQRVEFVHGNMKDLDWSPFRGIYLFNPFFENVIASASLDTSVPRGFEIYQDYVRVVRRKLAALSVGTRVATYHGFGGKVPDGYVEVIRDRVGTDELCVWVKVRETKPMTEEEWAATDLDEWGMFLG